MTARCKAAAEGSLQAWEGKHGGNRNTPHQLRYFHELGRTPATLPLQAAFHTTKGTVEWGAAHPCPHSTVLPQHLQHTRLQKLIPVPQVLTGPSTPGINESTSQDFRVSLCLMVGKKDKAETRPYRHLAATFKTSFQLLSTPYIHMRNCNLALHQHAANPTASDPTKKKK